MRITLTIRDGRDAASYMHMAARCVEQADKEDNLNTVFGCDGMYLLATRTKSGGLSFRQCTETPKQEQPR